MKVRNTFIIFVVSGFWHGANWTFVFWGLLNAIYFLPLLLGGSNRNNLNIAAENRWFPSLREFGQILLTFSLTVLAWIFFRADSMRQGISYIQHLLIDQLYAHPAQILLLPKTFFMENVTLFIIVLLITEWAGRTQKHALEGLKTSVLRWPMYIAVMYIIFFYGRFDTTEFIYFQF